MRALAKRHTPFTSQLTDSVKSYCLTIEGMDIVIDFRNHALKRVHHRQIIHANVVHLIKQGFNEIIELKNQTTFVLTNVELDMSVVGCVSCIGTDIVIYVITVIDSCEPKRKDTLMIAI